MTLNCSNQPPQRAISHAQMTGAGLVVRLKLTAPALNRAV